MSVVTAQKDRSLPAVIHLPRHMPALDGLRGAAIIMVLLDHTSGGWPSAMSIYRDTMTWPPTFLLPGWLEQIVASAVHGVTLFFVVSAFTLTLSLNPGSDLRAYALRRIARVGLRHCRVVSVRVAGRRINSGCAGRLVGILRGGVLHRPAGSSVDHT